MSIVEPKEICELQEIEELPIEKSVASKKNGIVFVPALYGQLDQPVIMADTGDFIKWLKSESPNIEVDTNTTSPKLVLRSGDYWLPLAYLASDVTLPVYLNLVSSYLYEKARGALKGDSTRVHLSAVYEDIETGKIKRFRFEGDTESLKSAIKRFDLNKFLDE